MTLSTIKGVVDAVQDAVGAVSGIKGAPDYPTEQASDFPFVTTYPAKLAAIDGSPEQFSAAWDVNVEFHLARRNLPSEVQQSLELGEPLLNAIFSALKTGQVAHKGIEGEFTEMVWGDVQTIGYRFVVRGVRVNTAMS